VRSRHGAASLVVSSEWKTLRATGIPPADHRLVRSCRGDLSDLQAAHRPVDYILVAGTPEATDMPEVAGTPFAQVGTKLSGAVSRNDKALHRYLLVFKLNHNNYIADC